VVIQHDQVQLLFALLVVDSANQHSTGINAHHRTRGKIGDCKQGLSYQLFGLIIGMNTGENHPICARSVVQDEL